MKRFVVDHIVPGTNMRVLVSPPGKNHTDPDVMVHHSFDPELKVGDILVLSDDLRWTISQNPTADHYREVEQTANDIAFLVMTLSAKNLHPSSISVTSTVGEISKTTTARFRE